MKFYWSVDSKDKFKNDKAMSLPETSPEMNRSCYIPIICQSIV